MPLRITMVLVSVLFSLVSFLALEATGRSILIDRQLVPPICKKTLIAYDGTHICMQSRYG